MKKDDPTGPRGPASVTSRRLVLRAAAAIGVGTSVGWARQSGARQGESTPGAISAAGGDISQESGVDVIAGAPKASGPPRRGGSARVVRPGKNLANFNPSAFAQDQQVALSYLEPLLRPDPRTMEPRPWLASRWEWREQGRLLVLTLRDGIIWHDGSPLTAADAAFSYEVYRFDVESSVGGLFALVAAVDAPSDRELRVRFGERDANWLFNAATLPVFSRRQYEGFWAEQRGGRRTLSGFDWMATAPVGTGPWEVVDWDERRVDFRRFNRYWRDAAWLDLLEVVAEPGWQDRLGRWAENEPALAWPVRIQDVPDLGGEAGTVAAVPAASVMFAAFNFANPAQPSGSLWTDPRVRLAASMAIDRERYAEEVFGGFMRWGAAGTVAQPWANDAELTTPRFNPEGAAVLLGEAGWIDYNGDGIREDAAGNPLNLVAILRADSRPELAAVMARVGRDFAAVGMGLTVEVLAADAFDRRWVTERTYDLIAYAYDLLPGFTDFDLYGSAWDIRTNPAGWNPGGYANADADAAIDEFLGAVSIVRQADALRRLQRAVNEDLFGLWLGFPMDLVLVGEGVEGFVPDINWQTARTADLWLADEDG